MIAHEIEAALAVERELDGRIDADAPAPRLGELICALGELELHRLDDGAEFLKTLGGALNRLAHLALHGENAEIGRVGDFPPAQGSAHECREIPHAVIKAQRIAGVMARHVI